MTQPSGTSENTQSVSRSMRYLWKLLSLVFGNLWYARKIGVKIGEGCRIYSARFGSEPFLVSIGDRVTITSGVSFVTHDGSTWLMRDEKGRRFRFGRVQIGDDVFIGINSIIMPGVSIGSRCVIGAASVVTQSVAPGSVVVGAPARVIGSFEEFRARILAECPAESELPNKRATPYREWVESCLRKQQERH